MKIETRPINDHEITSGDLTYMFLPTGDLYEIRSGQAMINQWNSNTIDGSLNNLYLRVHSGGGIQWSPMLGVKSPSSVSFGDEAVEWKGSFENVSYVVTFSPDPTGTWFWKVDLEGDGAEVDVVYGQDLGLGAKAMVRTNEAYASQYIDHKPFDTEDKGFVIASRQNQPQPGGNPYVQQGCLTGADGYVTDGFQFFGLSYKETDEPELLKSEAFPNENYQYEFAYTGLKAVREPLNGSRTTVFYGLFKDNHPEPVKKLEFQDQLQAAWERVENKTYGLTEGETGPVQTRTGESLQTFPLTSEEVDALFPEKRFEEKMGDELGAFFTPTQEHVVFPAKERNVERPHGHILMTADHGDPDQEMITTTAYMTGIFNAQIAVGNTSLNKLMTNPRNALNIPKTSGQRIYIEKDGRYCLLTMPSLFEMGFNYARWYYKTEDDLIVVTNFTSVRDAEVTLHIESKQQKPYRFLVTNQLSMAPNEYEVPFYIEEKDGTYVVTADGNAPSREVHPELSYRFSFSVPSEMADEKALVDGLVHGTASLIAFELEEAAEWRLTIAGSLTGEFDFGSDKVFQQEKESYRQYAKELMNGFKLEHHGGMAEDVEKLNTLAWWYTHNMLVHYAVPHGLEQYTAAAWGTRDVCQGPAEYFLAMQKYDRVKDIIKTVYAHQYEDTGNWPQWFMFDEYTKVQQEESHGDIIVWPLKLLADYLKITGDTAILQEELPYTDRSNKTFTEHQPSLLAHVNKQIDYIKANFLHDTFLSSYGDGDWDDTLQPANQELKQYMVSSWTVALTYQSLTRLGEMLEEAAPEEAAEVKRLSEGVKRDYQKFLRDDKVISGFLYFADKENPEKMVHPSDSKTGIEYRLLPMTRSMISELFDEEEMKEHYELIRKHLYFPDGVRLMNKPARYDGGVSKHFKRAEQAANFGREIGLQYVHAHIRFIEAMAKIGKGKVAWEALKVINPVGIGDAVPNAEMRQSNAYFSSSDGKFNTRYEAAEKFDQLKSGQVKVKGGWRIYSSGPGIYLNQLVSNVLGVREEGDMVIFDPVLDAGLDGLTFEFAVGGRPVTIRYRLSGEENASGGRVTVNGEEVPSGVLSNRYRNSGVKISKTHIHSDEKNEIDVFV
ncbi:GH36-type glycosyl hydrolase domain-containing protein [Alteribacter keqinensis]|uniref:Cellobiose phosphorylase n=1 Tax=Alteribacter keqinensis TaxID=2483800 RepID=A0A3M7TTK0_9BACI|nr:cellobiose phosphorylase [Alteribacter keqinensis]RNA67683.1 cellobiose phosphorylase [Alteribacter keqinensis]